MAGTTAALVFVLATALVLHYGDALHCWVCSSDANHNCADPFNATSRQQYLVTDCDRDRAHSAYLKSAVCRKYKHKPHKDSDEVIVVRSCAWGLAEESDGPCSQTALHFVQHLESCSVCATDECNSAPGLESISLLFALPAALFAARIL